MIDLSSDGYGYQNSYSDLDLSSLNDSSDLHANRPWRRGFEVIARVRSHAPSAATSTCSGMTYGEADFFTKGAREGFQYIGKRHNLTPVQAWAKIEHGMKLLGIHMDDLEHLQAFIFGWEELTPRQLERWALRYPKRCPLLDAMCSLDKTCQILNQTQDWLLASKGSYGRTRSDVLPALPDPDGVRPVCTEPIKQKSNSWGVMAPIK